MEGIEQVRRASRATGRELWLDEEFLFMRGSCADTYRPVLLLDCAVHVVEHSAFVDRDALAFQPLVRPDDANVFAVDILSTPRGKVNIFLFVLCLSGVGHATDLFLLSHVVQFNCQLQLTLSFTFHRLSLFLIEMFFAQSIQCFASILQLIEFILQGFVVG